MYIYHSKPADVRVTVVGIIKEDELLISVSRCSSKDTFRKRNKIIHSKPSFTVATSKGPKVVPMKMGRVLPGGVDLAIQRIYEGCIYISYPLSECSIKQFNTIAKGIVSEVINNPLLVEQCKNR